MLSSSGIGNKETLTKNFISDQTYLGFTRKLNTGGTAFDAVEGYGQAANNSSAIYVFMGGFADQKITGELKWVAPADGDTHEIGVFARCTQFDADPYYYYARVDGGTAKLTKVVSGAFTNMSSNAFAVPIDTPVTIALSCVGTTISATFTCAGVGGSPLTLSTTDAAIASGGMMGMRSLSSAVWFRSFTAEEL